MGAAVFRADGHRLQRSRLHRGRRSRLRRFAGEPQALAQAIAAGQKPPEEALPEAKRELLRLAQLYVAANLQTANPMDKTQVAKDLEAFRTKYDGKPFELAWTLWTL